jgi:hypothetical protein
VQDSRISGLSRQAVVFLCSLILAAYYADLAEQHEDLQERHATT